MNTQIQPRKLVISHRAMLMAFVCVSALASTAFARNFPTTHYVYDIAVADINGDGINDIVTCGNLDNRSSVDVLLGNGDGTYQIPKESSVGPGPQRLVVGDFNLDGHL